MDYIFLSAIVGIAVLTVLASYDITCQWLINFWTRIPMMPEHLLPTVTPGNIKAKIPAFHFDVHGKKNHAQYSFSFMQGVGQVNGEGIEQLWAILKGGAAQTTEMGPGGRYNTLDNFCEWSNWRKMMSIGTFFLYFALISFTNSCPS
jgi:hypothetical protein